MRTNRKPPTVTIIILLCKKLQCCFPLRAKQIGQRQRWSFWLVYGLCIFCFYSFRLVLLFKFVEGAPIAFPSPVLKSSGVFIKIHVMVGYKSPKIHQQSFLWSALRDSLYQNPGKTKRLAYTAQAPGAIYSCARCAKNRTSFRMYNYMKQKAVRLYTVHADSCVWPMKVQQPHPNIS